MGAVEATRGEADSLGLIPVGSQYVSRTTARRLRDDLRRARALLWEEQFRLTLAGEVEEGARLLNAYSGLAYLSDLLTDATDEADNEDE